MSYDITAPPPPMNFSITVKNIDGLTAKTTYYDPIQDRTVSTGEDGRGPDRLGLTVEAVEYPRLLMIEEHPVSR